MPVVLTKKAVEGSTFVVTLSFTDENGQSVVPNTLSFSLTDLRGNFINDRKNISITPAASVDILLSGADLMVTDGKKRILYISGTYNSDAGNNLPLKDEVNFEIENLVNI